jgi:hypothetical protein
LRIAVAIGLFVTITVATGAARAGEVVVVAHAALPADSLTQKDVKRIFLGDKGFVGDTKLKLVGYANDDAMTEGFMKAALGMDGDRFRSYWVKEVFRSGRIPPRKVANSDEVLKTVAAEPGSVGFVPAEALAGAGGVKKVFSITVP